MKNTKVIKAKCTKAGLFFAVELAQFGSTWKAINMIPLTNEEYRMLAYKLEYPQRLKPHREICYRSCKAEECQYK